VTSIRAWDKAGTQGGGAYTTGLLMHKLPDGRFCIEDVVRGQWSAATREKKMKDVAENDAESEFGAPIIYLEQEPGSGGKDSALYTVQSLAGHNVRVEKVSGQGSKEMRAEPLAAQIEFGNVIIVKGKWNREFLEELRHFPAGKYKDQVDSASMAFNKLNMRVRKKPNLTVVRDKKDNWVGAA